MRTLYPAVKFKDNSKRDEFYQLDDRLQFILEDLARYCEANGYDFIITDMLSDAESDFKLGRVSKSHQEGRAADIRTNCWPEEFVPKFIAFAEAAHGNSGAISLKDGKRRLVVYHNNGNGIHCHIQVSRREK